MKRTKPKILFFFFYLLPLLTLSGCSLDTPDAPLSDNPFDPANPETGGDPFKVQALLAGNTIRVTWHEVIHPTITGYSLYRNENELQFTRIHEIALGTTAYLDTTVRHGYRYGYYVVARFGNHEGDSSNLHIAYVNTAPRIVIEGETVTDTPTRNVTLLLTAFDAERMLLSNTPDFARAVWEPFSPTKTWQLTTGAGTKRVYARAIFSEGDTSEVVEDAIEPAELNPVVEIAGGAAQTPTRRIPLRIDATGAIQMQMSNAALADSEAWVNFADSTQWELETGAGTKAVYVKVRNDFLIEGEASDQIEPAPLNPTLVINYGALMTSTRHVSLRILASAAIQMQLSNTPLTGNEHWIAYSDSLQWDLTTGAGSKTIYVKVRNDFMIEAETSDQIDPAPLNPNLQILPDSTIISHTSINLFMPNTNALEVKVANALDSSLVNWQAYRPQINWVVPSGDGWKPVYSWFRNDFFTGGPAIDSVGLDTRAIIASFAWSATGGDTLFPGSVVNFTMQAADDTFGAETGGSASVTVGGWQPVALASQAGGVYSGNYTITDHTAEVANALVTVSFIDKAGNVALSKTADRRLTRGLAAGEERDFPLADTTIRMCWIPAGSFMMGRNAGEQESNGDEDPRHQVVFTQGFWMGKYELTQGQWEAVMQNNPASGYGEGANVPVYAVTWFDIQEFESRLSDVYRLPSESEWEYACRAGTTTRFYWGDDPSYNQIEIYARIHGGSSSQVGGKESNSWGLCDMSGNVAEWCEDRYHNNYTDAPTDGSAWIVGGEYNRVLRGGEYNAPLSKLRSSCRSPESPDSRGYIYGFRLVRDAD